MKVWNHPAFRRAVGGCCDVMKAVAIAGLIHWLGFGS